MRRRQICYSILASLIFIALIPGPSYADLQVPIIISEAKPSDVAGIDRINESATFGIPLMEENNITDISQLSLSGVSCGQFRVLKRYPLSGKIWWVLVDTQVSVNADGSKNIVLTDGGTGNFGGGNLAAEDVEFITINTGTALFKIKKQNFNFIDSAIVDGVTLVSSGHAGGVEVESNSKIYSSIYDTDPTLAIEENGPVRTCIKIYGRLADSSGNQFMGYTLRMHFYKGKTYIRTHFTLRNAYLASSVTAYPLKRAGIVLPTNLDSSLFFELSRKDSTVSGAIDEEKYLFQGYDSTLHNVYADDNFRYDPPRGQLITPLNGLIINGSTYNEYSQGWGEIKNSSNFGITVCMKFMSIYWPAGIEITGNKIEIDTLSGRNSIEPKFGAYVWETRELLHDFHITPANNKYLLYALQYPLMGRVADFDWYRQAKAILGQQEYITVSEQNQYHVDNSIEWREIENATSALKLRRYYAWWASGGLQGDAKFDDLFNYLRTGNGVLWILGEQSAIHKANHAIKHSDEFDYKVTRPTSVANDNNYNYNNYDWAHCYSSSMYLYYYLSGNEQIKEANQDYLEWLDYDSDLSIKRAQQGGIQGDLRSYARTYRAFAFFHDLLEDERSLSIMKILTKWILKRKDPSTFNMGRNLNRGYFWIPCGHPSKALLDFHVTKIFADAVWQNIRVFEEYDPAFECLEDLKDFYLGLAYFLKEEFTGGGTDGHTYGLYTYYIDEPNVFDSTPRPAMAGYLQTFGYQQTGNPDFLFKGWLKKMYYPGTYQAWERETQALIYTDIHQNTPTINYINPVGNGQITLSSSNVTNNGSGNYTLSWSVPAGGVNKYQIKFSDQPIVENLNFNQYADAREKNGVLVAGRSYQYDPNIYDNFWASLNVNDEPVPTDAGTTQTYTINVQEKIDAYNARYGLSAPDSLYLYIAYDPAKTYHFAIKYIPLDNDKPGQVTNVASSSHTISTMSDNNIITLTWTAATDTGGSGLDGYSIMWDTIADTIPDMIKDIGVVTTITSTPLDDGNNYYFHIMAVDGAGNFSDGAVHIGPFIINAPPSAPTSLEILN